MKCDGRTPACSRCRRYGSSCIYALPSRTSIAHMSSTIQNLTQRLCRAPFFSVRKSTISRAYHFPAQAEMALATRNDTTQPLPLASVPPSFNDLDLSAWTLQNNQVSQVPVPDFSTDIIPTTSGLLGQQTEVHPMQAAYPAFDALDPGGMDTILTLDMMDYTADSYLSPTQHLPTVSNIHQSAPKNDKPPTHLEGTVSNEVSGPILSEAPTPSGPSSSGDSNRTSLSSITLSDL